MVRKLKCVKCEYEWLPRIENTPKECPRCKSLNWKKIKIDKYKNNLVSLEYNKIKLLEKLRIVNEKIKKIKKKNDTPFDKYRRGEIGIEELYRLEKEARKNAYKNI